MNQYLRSQLWLSYMKDNIYDFRISEERFWHNYFYRVSLVKKVLMSKAAKQAEEKPQTSTNEVVTPEAPDDSETPKESRRSPSLKEELDEHEEKEKAVKESPKKVSKDSTPTGNDDVVIFEIVVICFR